MEDYKAFFKAICAAVDEERARKRHRRTPEIAVPEVKTSNPEKQISIQQGNNEQPLPKLRRLKAFIKES